MLVRVSAALLAAMSVMASSEQTLRAQPHIIQVLIGPRCKWMFFGLPFVSIDGKPKKLNLPKYVPWDPTSAKSMVYKDPRSSISFYVESDGRHLAGIDSEGKLLWVRNPFEDRQMCPYRTARPVIDDMKATEIFALFSKAARAVGCEY